MSEFNNDLNRRKQPAIDSEKPNQSSDQYETGNPDINLERINCDNFNAQVNRDSITRAFNQFNSPSR